MKAHPLSRFKSRAAFARSWSPRKRIHSDVERVAEQVANQANGDRPSIVVVGEKFDSAVNRPSLQNKGPVWSLRIPFDDAELSFVADSSAFRVE